MVGRGGGEGTVSVVMKPELAELSLSSVVSAEARLKGFIQFMVGHMLVELVSNCSFSGIS